MPQKYIDPLEITNIDISVLELVGWSNKSLITKFTNLLKDIDLRQRETFRIFTFYTQLKTDMATLGHSNIGSMPKY